MKTMPAKELKRRGVAAIEHIIDEGPVEIIKNNRPTCIILSISHYKELTEKRPVAADRRMKISELFALPAQGKRKRKAIDAELRQEREGWG